MKHLLYAIGWVWLLPVNLLALCWLLPMKARGTFNEIYWDWNSWSLTWEVNECSNFYENSMSGWWGFVIGNNIIRVEYIIDDIKEEKHIKHEQTHVLQNYIFGAFFYPIYIIHSTWIYLFNWKRHVYYDNFLEIWARRVAKQQIFIPVQEWRDGPNDRCPWW